MLSQKIFYKNMKNWLSKDRARPLFQKIYFDGEKAIATDTHVIAIVDKQDTPHYETADGVRVEETGTFPDYKRVLVDKSKAKWLCEIDTPKRVLDLWKVIGKAIATIAKDSYGTPCRLDYKDGNLQVIVVDKEAEVKAKFVLASTETPIQRSGFFQAKYLQYAMDFLKDIEPGKVSIYTNGYILAIETYGVLMQICGMHVRSDEKVFWDKLDI